MQNRDVFLKDPTTYRIPNDGVAKVLDPRTSQEWDVLRYELSSFVCEGEYRRGLEHILSTYLTNLAGAHRADQPAVWVSGFYGSGKSHLVRVLEYLWRDVAFPDGVRARGLAHLPQDVAVALKELSNAARREGGLWSAAGTLGAGAGGSVRLALLAILLRSARLPEQYAPARFVIWLKQRGYYDRVCAALERMGESLEQELENMYVSPVLAAALLDAYPEVAANEREARGLLKAQFPDEDDISDDAMLRMMEDVLELQATAAGAPGKLPLTLLIFDELQQFIGQDPERTLQVQGVVEACCARFGSRLLFIATGQAALQATPQLSKLQGRFTVSISLSDADVEQVVRTVVLGKRPDSTAALKAVLDTASGEIDRHLGGTRIGASLADAPDMVPDYPLLPVRRRFWEHVLRAVDSAGAAGQLRTQLRIVHDATAAIADRPLGHVVPGDVIFGQLKAYMLQSAILLRDIDAAIAELDNGAADGKLRARLCALIFLIGRLSPSGPADIGVHATADVLADLLVEDLTAGSATLRQRIPALLQSLVDSGMLMLVEGEYRLQTRESREWEDDYRRAHTRIAADPGRIAADRETELRAAITAALKGLTSTQGASRTARKHELFFGAEAPPIGAKAGVGGSVPVWVRDGWSVSERVVRDEARLDGVDNPVVTVYLPNHDADALKAALAGYAAARECLDARPLATTDEGVEARRAMLSRRDSERGRLDALIAATLTNARVFLGGGTEVGAESLQAMIREAIDAALARLFPRFSVADSAGWSTVVKRVGDGSADALAAVKYTGDAEKHPVCAEIRQFIGGAGKRGIDVRKHFMGPPFGWPQDAVDGALLTLTGGGFVRASRNGQQIAAKDIAQSGIGVIDFHGEGVSPPTATQRLEVRKLLADVGLPSRPNEELETIGRVLQRLADLAATAGGAPPLPQRPSTETIERLLSLSGNEQCIAVWERRDDLLGSFADWTRARDTIAERQGGWQRVQRLLRHAGDLPVSDEIRPQAEAIITGRFAAGRARPGRAADGRASRVVARRPARGSRAFGRIARARGGDAHGVRRVARPRRDGAAHHPARERARPRPDARRGDRRRPARRARRGPADRLGGQDRGAPATRRTRPRGDDAAALAPGRAGAAASGHAQDTRRRRHLPRRAARRDHGPCRRRQAGYHLSSSWYVLAVQARDVPPGIAGVSPAAFAGETPAVPGSGRPLRRNFPTRT